MDHNHLWDVGMQLELYCNVNNVSDVDMKKYKYWSSCPCDNSKSPTFPPGWLNHILIARLAEIENILLKSPLLK